jgi:hypothetical protein
MSVNQLTLSLDDQKTQEREKRELHQSAQLLQQLTERKNNVTMAEFAPYLMLFDTDVRAGVSDDVVQETADQFVKQFDRFNKITIYDRDPNKPGAQIVAIVPPIFVKTALVNEVGEDAMHKLTAFSNALAGQSDPIFGRQQIATILATQVVKQLTTDKILSDYEKMLNHVSVSVPSGPTVDDFLITME